MYNCIINKENFSEVYNILNTENIFPVAEIEISNDLTYLQLLSVIESILDFEKTDKSNIRFSIKTFPFEIRKSILKYCLLNSYYHNSTILLNLIYLIRSYNNLDETFFSNKYIFINDISEFLDFKMDLKNEFSIFITNLSKWYISLFKSAHKINPNYLDNMVDMPETYQKIIELLDFYTLSGIFAKADKFNTEDLYLVNNAYDILLKLTNKNIESAALLNAVLEKNN